MHGKVYAVVGHPGLGVIIGADAFRTVAGTNLGLAVGGHFLVLALLFGFKQTGAKNLEGLFPVFVLRFFILAGNRNSGRQVGKAHGGVRCVHALPAGAGRAEDVHTHIIGLYFNVHFLGLGQNGHRNRRSMNAPLRLRGGNTLHTVGAGLVFEPAVNLAAADKRNNFLVSTIARFRRA